MSSHSRWGQPQVSRLVSFTHTAAEAWEECWWGASAGEEVGGLRWLASVNTDTRGIKISEICRGSVVAVLALVSSVMKAAGFVYPAGFWES